MAIPPAFTVSAGARPNPNLSLGVGSINPSLGVGGGPYRDNAEVHNGAESVVPIDLYIPGCPPHPLTILDGLLRLLGKIETGERATSPSAK